MRDDITNNLIHLTKGISADVTSQRDEAFKNFQSIVAQQTLIGGTGYIRGSFKCVCFSEAPIGKLSHILAAARSGNIKYQPFGVMVSKTWLFEKGGRPAIYGPSREFDELPDHMRYRHVRFSLGEYEVDHSWEREWRIKIDALVISPEEVTLVVPDRKSKEMAVQKFGTQWHYVALSDVGVQVA